MIDGDNVFEPIETTGTRTGPPIHGSHVVAEPTLAEVNARWCANCNRMILTDQGKVSLIGTKVCGIDIPSAIRPEVVR